MTAPVVHRWLTLKVSNPAGWRGSCTCGTYEGPRQGALALAERDAQAHAKEGNRCRRRAWLSREAAERAIVDTRQRKQRAELCPDPDCRGWHLTSQAAAVQV